MSASKFLYTVLAALIFGAGYAFADALRTADIQRLKADYAQAAQEYQAKLTKREADNAKKLAEHAANIITLPLKLAEHSNFQ